eukprot:2959471-Pleurochrysis_carterae.AAC.3
MTCCDEAGDREQPRPNPPSCSNRFENSGPAPCRRRFLPNKSSTSGKSKRDVLAIPAEVVSAGTIPKNSKHAVAAFVRISRLWHVTGTLSPARYGANSSARLGSHGPRQKKRRRLPQYLYGAQVTEERRGQSGRRAPDATRRAAQRRDEVSVKSPFRTVRLACAARQRSNRYS